MCIDGETGRLVPVGDRAALRRGDPWPAGTIPPMLRPLPSAAGDTCCKNFSAERMNRELLALYESLIARKRDKSRR